MARKLVEDQICLDINLLTRRRAFKDKPQNKIKYAHRGERIVIEYKFERQANRLFVPISGQRIELTMYRSHWNGVKYLFICDDCQQKRKKLYWIEEKFVCRLCGNLTYRWDMSGIPLFALTRIAQLERLGQKARSEKSQESILKRIEQEQRRLKQHTRTLTAAL